MGNRKLAARLADHIGALTRAGPRHWRNPAGVAAARDHITGTLNRLKLPVVEQRYGDQPHQANFVVELHPDPAVGFLDIGAHWDSVADSPGADDNATGAAGLLEIAGELAADERNSSVRLCFFGEEEQGDFPGSSAHLQASADRGDSIDAALVLEMIGYRDRTPGSQQLPQAAAEALSALGMAAPDTGDFIGVVGDTSAAEWVEALSRAAESLDQPLPVIPLVAPVGMVSDAGRSDHATYWRHRIPAVMVTDTANFRNPHYHRPTDTTDTLDLEFAAQVTQMVLEAIRGRRSVPQES